MARQSVPGESIFQKKRESASGENEVFWTGFGEYGYLYA
jgi:hypothetical protein